jgi:solute carrier family 25 protein 38
MTNLTRISHALFPHPLPGMFAGALATLVTHPFDIIKTRMQTSPPIMYDGTIRPTSMILTAKEILKVDGIGAYLDGLGLRCARKAASSAVGWTIFEAGRRSWVGKELQRQEKKRLAEGVTLGG